MSKSHYKTKKTTKALRRRSQSLALKPLDFVHRFIDDLMSLRHKISFPIVTAHRVFLTASEGGNLVTLAQDRKTGKTLWRRDVVRACCTIEMANCHLQWLNPRILYSHEEHRPLL